MKPTADHVTPRCVGATRLRNKLFAHAACNELKAGRMPWPCELLFLEITNEICAAGVAEALRLAPGRWKGVDPNGRMAA